MALKGAKSRLQQEMPYGCVTSSRIQPLTRPVGKFGGSPPPQKKRQKKNAILRIFASPPAVLQRSRDGNSMNKVQLCTVLMNSCCRMLP